MKKGVPPSRAAVAAAAQLRRQGSLRRSTSNRNQNRRSFTTGSTASLIDTCPLDMSGVHDQSSSGVEKPSEPDNWTAHPSPMEPASSVESTLEAHNRRWSIMSHEQLKGQSISPQQSQAPFESIGSSTDPNVHYSLQHHGTIRCICGRLETGYSPLLQCRACTTWSHAHCEGLDGQTLPANYLCFNCRRPPSRQ
jgi:hypothetical protein